MKIAALGGSVRARQSPQEPDGRTAPFSLWKHGSDTSQVTFLELWSILPRKHSIVAIVFGPEFSPPHPLIFKGEK